VPSLNTVTAQALSVPLFTTCLEEVFSETQWTEEGMRIPLRSRVNLFRGFTIPLRQAHAAGEVERTRQYDHEERQDPYLDEQDLTLFHT
jgi:hypothetical protein